MLFALAFLAEFLLGGVTGIFLGASAADVYFHDTYFIVAHFHYVIFGGTMFAIFGGIAYWFPKMFSTYFDSALGKVHFWLTFIFFNL